MIVPRWRATRTWRVGPANADDQRQQREQHQRGRDVALPAGPAGRDRCQQVDAREAQRVLAPRSLHEHVGDQQTERHDDQQEPQAATRSSRDTPLVPAGHRGEARAPGVSHGHGPPASAHRPAAGDELDDVDQPVAVGARARDARRPRRGSPGRSTRGALAPRPRNGSAATLALVCTCSRRPVSGSTNAAIPIAGSTSSRGSTVWTATT